LAPSFHSRATFTIPAGSTVQLHERHGEWVLVAFRGNRGWIHDEFLLALTPEQNVDSL